MSKLFSENQVIDLLAIFAENGAIEFAGRSFKAGHGSKIAYNPGTAATAPAPAPEADEVARARAQARAFNSARTGRSQQSVTEMAAEILASLPADLPDRASIAEVRASARAFNAARMGA